MYISYSHMIIYNDNKMAKRVGGHIAASDNYEWLTRIIIYYSMTARDWRSHSQISEKNICSRYFREFWQDYSLEFNNTGR